LTLLLDTLLPPLAGRLGLRTLGVHLLLDDPLAGLLSLGLVDVFNESTLVLEGVTLGEVVELVVEVPVDLSGGAVLDEETAEDTEMGIQTIWLGIRASLVPFLLPKPRCRPIRRAAVSSRARARECMVTGLRMMRPSETSLRMVWRELALEISLISLGSIQTLFLPHLRTAAESRFCSRIVLIFDNVV